MRPIRLPKRQILRFRTEELASRALETMPEGHAFRDGNDVHLVRPVNMTFSPVDVPILTRQ